ncbi:MAG: hypothetical protein JRF72_03900 [Deltaproteobacteria bacterium]|jgi:hypothetical protein|nr:hypothetical protein [Deltaproteobacteria bacterium]
MQKLLLIVSLALIVTACSHGKTEHFPDLAQSTETAEIIIIRNNNLLGWGFSVRVFYDEMLIANLRAGEHLTFFVPPGFHTVGTSDDQITVPLNAGQKHYFLISADYTQFGFEISRISGEKGENWLGKTRPLK